MSSKMYIVFKYTKFYSCRILWNFDLLDGFSKNQYQIYLKSTQREPSCSMRTGGHDEANSRYSAILRTSIKTY